MPPDDFITRALERFDGKLDRLDERLDKIQESQARQGAVLEEHQRRSLANEAQIKILHNGVKEQVESIREGMEALETGLEALNSEAVTKTGLWKIILGLSTLVGLAGGLLKLIAELTHR